MPRRGDIIYRGPESVPTQIRLRPAFSFHKPTVLIADRRADNLRMTDDTLRAAGSPRSPFLHTIFRIVDYSNT